MREKMNKKKLWYKRLKRQLRDTEKMRTATKWRYFPTTSARKKNYDWADHKEGLQEKR